MHGFDLNDDQANREIAQKTADKNERVGGRERDEQCPTDVSRAENLREGAKE